MLQDLPDAQLEAYIEAQVEKVRQAVVPKCNLWMDGNAHRWLNRPVTQEELDQMGLEVQAWVIARYPHLACIEGLVWRVEVTTAKDESEPTSWVIMLDILVRPAGEASVLS